MPADDDPALSGLLPVTVTYLEMTAPPARAGRPAPLGKLALMRAERPTLSWYRYLYQSVGTPWLWGDRLRLGDAALTARILDPRTAVYVVYEAGVPAGFAELFRHDEATTELVYFGLIPEFFGKALGPWFLDEILAIAWRDGPRRVVLETCSLDHPKALPLYQRAGFVPYRREQAFRADPRAQGLIPPDAGVRKLSP